MKVHIPRMLVGGLLLAMVPLMIFVGLPGSHAQGVRIVLASILAFIGTQVFLGRRLPGFRRPSRDY